MEPRFLNKRSDNQLDNVTNKLKSGYVIGKEGCEIAYRVVLRESHVVVVKNLLNNKYGSYILMDLNISDYGGFPVFFLQQTRHSLVLFKSVANVTFSTDWVAAIEGHVIEACVWVKKRTLIRSSR